MWDSNVPTSKNIKSVRILFLTDNFPPEVNAPASRTFEHCREWVRAGHQVTVITGAPNFPKGKLLGGYRNYPWQWEEIEGIRVLRVFTFITANEGFVRRTLDYMSFMVTSFLAGLFVTRPDVVAGTSPQFFTVCSAWMLSVFRRRPFVFELRDLWPESIKAVGAMKHPYWLERLEKLEYFLYRKAALIVTVTRSFRNTLVDNGVDDDRIKVVTNGVDLERYRPLGKDVELVKTYGLEGKFVLGYIGTHGLAHALETLLDAAARFQNEATDQSCVFLFLGDGASKRRLIDCAGQRQMENVIFIDSVPKDQVVRYWGLLDASITHLRKSELFESVIPSKLFESMAMGVPVLHGVSGESAEIVVTEQVGIPFPPEDSDALYKAILRLKGDQALQGKLRQNCLEAARKYDRRNQAEKMLGHLQALIQA